MLDLTKPVQTSDGRAVRILCTDRQGNLPVIGLITELCGTKESLKTWAENGSCLLSDATCNSDLVNVPVEHTVWINMYANGDSFSYKNKNIADKGAADKRIACVEVTFKEGDGL